MSELASRKTGPVSARAGRAVTCYCDQCSRLLYVAADELFCPVCSSMVSRIEVGPELDLAVAQRLGHGRL